MFLCTATSIGLHAAEPPELIPLPVIEAQESFEFGTDKTKTSSSAPSFYALKSSTWPNSLVPIFGYEVRGIYRLSRSPKTGWENVMEPIFFALPSESETNSANLTGAWLVSATHRYEHTDEFSWELTTYDDQVAGRFELHTDYRFASIAGGTWRSNRIDLMVDYINEHFELNGSLKNGELSGKWRRTDDGDGGNWTAVRLNPDPILRTNSFKIVPLYERINTETKERSYSVSRIYGEGFEITSKPLCQVWLTQPE